MLQSIHLISASSCARPRLVTRLKTFELQFWTVMYWIFAPFMATSSTTALCSVAVVNFGAVQPFHVGDLRPFIGDDEGALELAEVLGVDAEIGLERVFHLHARRHIDEAAAAENRRCSAR